MAKQTGNVEFIDDFYSAFDRVKILLDSISYSFEAKVPINEVEGDITKVFDEVYFMEDAYVAYMESINE